jgi:sugar phosphate isomerase/epimerase
MKLGITSWSVPWSVGVQGYPKPPRPLGAMGLLEKAFEANVSVVQIADNLPLHELEDAELDRLREAACAQALTLEVGTRGVDPTHLQRYVAIAKRVGASVIRTVFSGSLCSPQQLAAAEGSLREILPVLEGQRVTLALENNEAFSASQFAGIIERIASPFVGICLDTANSLGRPETLQTVVENLAEYAVMLHAKDYDIRRIDTRMGFSVVGTPAGAGRVDFDWVFAELERRGRTEISVIVEHWPPFAGTIEETIRIEKEWLSQSVQFLRAKVPSGAPFEHC